MKEVGARFFQVLYKVQTSDINVSGFILPRSTSVKTDRFDVNDIFLCL